MELVVYLELFAIECQDLTTHLSIAPLYFLIAINKFRTIIIRLDPA